MWKYLIMAWDYLNGKKTKIGALIVFLPVILNLLGLDKWGNLTKQIIDVLLDPAAAKVVVNSLPDAATTLTGAGVVGIGLFHKLLKKVKK